MSDRHAFLEAIRAAPDDDAPRLIYADWLDDNGEPERAAFIRYGVAAGGWTSRGPRVPMIKRFRLNRPGRTTGRNISHLGDFDRGFVGRVNIDSFAALADLPRLRETEPAHALGFGGQWTDKGSGEVPGLADALGGCAELTLGLRGPMRERLPHRFAPTCRRLRLSMYGDRPLGRLELPHVRDLTLYFHSREALVEALARCGPDLEALHLSLDDTAMSRIAPLEALDWPASVRHLDFGFCPVPAALALIESGNLPNLRSAGLSVRASGVDPAVLDDLKGWPTRVALSRVWLGAYNHPDGDRLFEALRPLASGVEDLKLQSGGEFRARSRLDPAEWPRLRRLESYGHTPRRDDVAALLGALAPSVEELIYQLPPPGFFLGPDWREERGLRRLKLSAVADAELRSLVHAPALARLEVLDADVGPSAAAVNAIARSPMGRYLKALNLHRGAGNKAIMTAADKFGPRCDLYWHKG